jgi:hypothetical protein
VNADVRRRGHVSLDVIDEDSLFGVDTLLVDQQAKYSRIGLDQLLLSQARKSNRAGCGAKISAGQLVSVKSGMFLLRNSPRV